MGVLNNTANDAFAPYRGADAAIQQFPITNGSVYFAYDTKKIYFDMDGARHVMSGDGIHFVYGRGTGIGINPVTNLYDFPRIAIEAEHYLTNDIIINLVDGVFYRIISLNDTYAECERLLVSGSGGGNTGEGSTSVSLNIVENFPGNIPYGRSAIGKFKVFDAMGGTDGTLEIIYKDDNKEDTQPRYIERKPIPVGQEFTVELKAHNLKPGDQNYIVLQAEVDDQFSNKRTRTINCVSLSFGPGSGWNPNGLFDLTKTPNVMFPYVITSANEKDYIDMSVDVEFTIDKIHTKTYTVTDQVGELSLTELLNTVQQGGHDLSIVATTVIGGTRVIIGDLYYGLGILKGETDPSKLAPLIWSPYNKTEEDNYVIIEIPYMVYDPTRTDEKADVEFYINNKLIKTETIAYNASAYAIWEIADYIPEQLNSFVIKCKDTTKPFNVYIKKNYELNLDPIDGSVVYLPAAGHSNTDNARATWENKATAVDKDMGLGEAVLEGFNWSNNGWVKNTSENCTALRVSNGATVTIPMKSMQTSTTGSRTYEFDFLVRNATDYSRLINDIQVPVMEEDGVTQKRDEYGALLYDVIKEVSSGEGAFLTYYDNEKKRGFMLGTQEAFFSWDKNAVVNVRYTDNRRVKVSIVIDSSGDHAVVYNENKYPTGAKIPMVYIYINGVLTNIMSFTNDECAADISNIEINSNYCDVDLFNIRIYPTALNYSDITQNWVGDAPTLIEKQNRYAKNQALVENNTISYKKVKEANIIPTMVIKTYSDSSTVETDDRLPFFKDGKKAVGIRFYDPEREQGFHCENVEIDVQGTSSQGYPRRNYKIKTEPRLEGQKKPATVPDFKFETWDGAEANKDHWFNDEAHMIEKFDLLQNGIAEKVFCLKADYMESAGCHNTGMANLMQSISIDHSNDDVYDFRHPLNKDFDLTDAFRTTIGGFPMLLFHENAAGEITFVGKYNFNLDKGSKTSFGFGSKKTNPYSPMKIHQVWEESENGDEYLVTETQERRSTFKEIAECWEFKQNQTGLGKFQCEKDFWDITKTGDNKDRLEAYSHFEPRYLYLDFDPKDEYEAPNAKASTVNAEFKKHLGNFERMWSWVHSTDTLEATNESLDEPKFYQTISTEYEDDIHYWSEDGQSEVTITPILEYVQNTEKGVPAVISVTDPDRFYQIASQVFVPEGVTGNAALPYVVGAYTFTKDLSDGVYYFKVENDEGTYDQWSHVEMGVEMPEIYGGLTFTINCTLTYDGFNTDLMEKFTIDSPRYRKAKFKNELSEHFDLEYMLMYYIMTELLLLYDSRQKNMMIATWGPTREGGEYIWYPIFYDMDTQCGVNNSGFQSWDYDVDASVFREREDGSWEDQSIYSGAGSVLWINFGSLFQSQIQYAYRALRSGALTEEALNNYYNVRGSDKWSEIMKNIDADYKYIAPSTTGFTNQSGKWEQKNIYYYCVQGDRALNRQAFFRNRLNYLDSQWLGGVYDPSSERGTNIRMRFNANDVVNTSDNGTNDALFQAEASYDLKAYLSQYLSILYDQTATTPQKFVSGQDEPVHIEPFDAIANRLEDNIPLSQQLVYIRGPEYISDLGDLSLKYLNELDYSAATRLRSLYLGSMVPGYKNTLFSNKGGIESKAGTTSEKGLLSYMELSNLSSLSGELDISGCTKIDTFKALNTPLSSVVLPSGSLLKKLYLSKSTAKLCLNQPLMLKNLLSTQPTLESQPDGLYVEGLTDKLGEIDNSSTTAINGLQLNDTKLGLGSYKILNHIFQIKEKIKKGEITTGSSKLALELQHVEWSPYTKIPMNTEINRAKKHYLFRDGVCYEEITFDGTNIHLYDEYVKDGLLFYKDDSMETDVITDLTLLATIMDDYDKAIEYADQRYTQYGQSLTNKAMPQITGRMHICNDTEHLIDEFDLHSIYKEHYSSLEITADHLDPALRVEFIEYGMDGTKKTLDWSKYSKKSTSAPVSYNGDRPIRLHYDFIGWAVDSAELREKKSILTKEEQANYTIVQTQKLASTYDLTEIEGGALTLVAIYEIHSYEMTFMNGGKVFGPIVTVPANAVIGDYVPAQIPYRDDTNLMEYDIYECNKFLGWHVQNDSSEDVTDLSKMLADSDCIFFAKFAKTSVYDNVVPQEWLQWRVLSSYSNRQTGVSIAFNEQFIEAQGGSPKGKFCFPREITVEDGTTYPVYGLLGSAIGDNAEMNGLAHNPELFAIFFEGANDGTAVIQELAQFCCYGSTSLYYIDCPPSLTKIGQAALNSCPNLAIENAEHVTNFGDNAFLSSAQNHQEDNEMTIGGTITYAGGGALGGYWKCIYLGTRNNPLTKSSLNLLRNSEVFSGVYGVEEALVYPLKKLEITYLASELTQEEIEEQLPTMLLGYEYFIDESVHGENFVTFNAV